jgi:hypothetical protein
VRGGGALFIPLHAELTVDKMMRINMTRRMKENVGQWRSTLIFSKLLGNIGLWQDWSIFRNTAIAILKLLLEV